MFATRPDAVLGGGWGTPGALPYLALRERGYQGQFYATPAIINPAFVKVGGAAVEGLIASTSPRPGSFWQADADHQPCSPDGY